MTTGLPINAILGELRAVLAAGMNAVLVAPPGAGKTTRVPLALLDEPWAAGGRLILLEPRRLAARGAAARMASTLGERVGETVGHRMRADVKIGPVTRIDVVTEGVFTRMILSDPSLEGVAGVIFDEFHERSLDGDLGLAFALEAQALLRPDLRLLVMSATLDGAAVSRLMGNAPVIESEGRAHPVETRHRPRDAARRLDDDTARLVREALANETGDVLVFLAGQAEIRRTAERLAETVRSPVVDVRPLYGALTPAEQDAAIAPSPPGRRKVVLATSIAQTSLTIEGVRVVVDAGLSRAPRFDVGTGLTRLVTVKVSRAAADQRRGRAGRTQPGVCYRLWDATEERGLPLFDRPEIADSDLSGVALAMAQWGAKDPAALPLLDPPPAAAFAEAVKLLQRIGALSADRALTPHGAKLARIGTAPRLAHMIVEGAGRGLAGRAARLAAVLSEPGLGGTGVDVSARVERLSRDPGGRGRDALALAGRWAKAAGGAAQAGAGDAHADGLLIATAFPERIAKARGGDGGFLLANGRGARLEPTDALARAPWLAVAELAGGAAQDRIMIAAPLTEAEVRDIAGADLVSEETVEIDDAGRLQARRRLRLGRIVVEDRLLDRPSREAVASAFAERVRTLGLGVLPWSEAATSLRARIAFMAVLEPDGDWPDVSDAALSADLEAWLGEALATAGGLDRLVAGAVEAALRDHVGWSLIQRLDREAPTRMATPAGGSALIDYGAEGGPRVEVRVQELFGLARHPTTASGRVPLTLALLSPARRPVQTTKDLRGFWAGSWKAVRMEMRGRYPRHPWPEDPLTAPPTTRAKPRGT
ncbi:ATP-dependent helicase HrpB [soil metagenome]